MSYFVDMDLWKILAELQEERTRIEEAIVALEHLTLGHGKGRGRPPAWVTAIKDKPRKRKGGPSGSRNKPKRDAIEIQTRLHKKNFVTPFQTWRTAKSIDALANLA